MSDWLTRRTTKAAVSTAVTAGGALALALAAMPAVGAAPDAPAKVFHPDISRVAVFKNGYVFTFREGEPPVRDGWVTTPDVPAGVLGTVWGYGTGPVSVTELLASEKSDSVDGPVESMQDLMLQNEGARARIRTTDKEEYEGTYTVLTTHPRETEANEVEPDPTPDNRTILPPSFDLAIKTDKGLVVMNFARITDFELLGEPKLKKAVSIRRRELRLKLEPAPAGAPGGPPKVGVAALEKGIRWIPGYRVALLGDTQKQARLDLDAVLINDLADIHDADFNFVVGVPHFLMDNMLSPLALRTAFTGLSSFFSDPGQRPGEAAMVGQFAYGNGFTPRETPTSAAAPPASLGEESAPTLSAEQLFLYEEPHFSLMKGERASLHLFSATVPCKEVFEWTITDPPITNPNAYSSQQSTSDMSSLGDRIWYSLKMKNTSSKPWTTGPASSFRDWKPMGQDMMPFTPVGQEAVLKVSPATEVGGEHVQVEKARQRDALTTANGNHYDLITVEGTIKLTNVKPTPVTVCITRRMDGEVLTQSDAGKASREGFDLEAINPHSVISWEVVVPTGAKDLSYSYKRYVQR